MSPPNAAGAKTGVVLSGGGARGAFQVGVWSRIHRHELFSGDSLILSGTSAGSLNSAFIAAGKSPEEMMNFWLDLTNDPPVQVSSRFFASMFKTVVDTLVNEPTWLIRNGINDFNAIVNRLKHHFPYDIGSMPAMIVEHLLATRYDIVSNFLQSIEESYLANIDRVRARLVKMFGGDTVPAGKHRLAINTVEVNTGKVVRYVNFQPVHRTSDTYVVVDAITVDMIMASAAIPLLFNPIRIGSRLLWDGGVLVNTPLAAAVALGADQIVTVMVTKGPAADSRVASFGDAIERLADSFLENAYNLDRKLCLERNRLSENHGLPYRKVTLFEEIRPDHAEVFSAGSYLHFRRDKLEEMFREGTIAADKWLAAGITEDKLPAPASA